MTIPREVIEDLLPVYLAGEASAATIRVVEEALRQDTDLAEKVHRARGATTLPESGSPDVEKRALDATRRLLRWRSVSLGFGLLLTLLPALFRFDNGRITWFFLDQMPAPVTALAVTGAAASWAAFFALRRRLTATGL